MGSMAFPCSISDLREDEGKEKVDPKGLATSVRTLHSSARSLHQVTVGAQVSQVPVGAQATWVLSAAETLLCSMASGSIFFLIARLLTVMVSAFTDYRNIKRTLENSSLDTTSLHRQQGGRRRKLSSNPMVGQVSGEVCKGKVGVTEKQPKAPSCLRRA